MMMKMLFKKIFLLDKDRYQGDVKFFSMWLLFDQDGTFDDGSIRYSIKHIPERIVPVYKVYINFNDDYFYALSSYSLGVVLITLPIMLSVAPLLVFLPGMVYAMVCIVLNCVVTFIELVAIKKEMLRLYKELQIYYQMN